jgi:hypothetical protein
MRISGPMTDSALPASAGGDLQFDRVVNRTPATAAGAVCAVCQQPIAAEYYDVNGNTVCDNCRTALEASAATPRGIGPLALAALFGFGAAIAGAAVYYAVMAITNLVIGLIAILCGYMVGYAVRKGAGGRGGRRFQLLAVLLTYVSVGLAYTPIVVQQIIGSEKDKPAAVENGGTTGGASAGGTAAADNIGQSMPAVLAAFVLVLLIAAMALMLPVLVIVGSGVSGLISLVILAVGIRQAWRMTAAPRLNIQGPYRVAAPPSVSA